MKERQQIVWKVGQAWITVFMQLMFVAYSGVLLITIGAPAYLWFIWAIYQLVCWFRFFMLLADCVEQRPEKKDLGQRPLKTPEFKTRKDNKMTAKYLWPIYLIAKIISSPRTTWREWRAL